MENKELETQVSEETLLNEVDNVKETLDEMNEETEVTEVKVLPNDKFEYLVKWKHQSYSHLSWLTYDDLVWLYNDYIKKQ